jgi:hypothetical protein
VVYQPVLEHLSGRRFPHFERANAFSERLLKRPADRHNFADRLHLSPENGIRARKLFELPPRNLDDHVIERRLETGGRLPCNVVANFVETIADRELRGNLGDRKSRCLRCQRRRSRHARVHLDNDHSPVRWINRELNVRSSGIDADLPQASQGGVAHHLILAIRQRLRGSHRDRVARMHAHRIEILDRANDDGVVGEIAHHLQFVFFPAEDALLDQRLVNRREIETALEYLFQFFAVICDASAAATQREARTKDHRIAVLCRELDPGFNRVHKLRVRHIEADLAHRIFEQQTVFGFLDRLDIRSDQLDAVFVENARLGEIHGQIQSGLPADS